jgi:DNA-binding HxlR family transcriptional regulator
MSYKRKLKDYNPYGCPVAHFMNAVGGKWKIIVFYSVSIKINRFSKLQKAIPAISKQTLVNVLQELEEDGLIKRVVFELSPRTEYELTNQSISLLPVIKMIEDWGINDMQRLDIQTQCSFKEISGS